ncbi:hypoxanthine phosphoribosyltransferase, partial [Thermoflexus hugenholtzii JAD2]
QAHLRSQGPRSLRTAVLLDKPYRRQVSVPVDYRGFEIPDLFVVGYGIDWAEHYRHL